MQAASFATILAVLSILLAGQPAARAAENAPPAKDAPPALIAPAVSTGTGLLLEPALTLPEFTREKFAAAAKRVPWLDSVITLPTESLLGPILKGDKRESEGLKEIARWIQPLVQKPWDMVINWSYSDPRVRLKLPVRISYKDDPEVALQVLLQARHRRAPTYRVIGERPGGTEPLWRVEVALTLPEGQVMVLAEASGPSLRAAEQEAARVALAAVPSDSSSGGV